MAPGVKDAPWDRAKQFNIHLHDAGVDIELQPPDDNQQLLWFQQDNITFNHVQLLNVDAFNMLYILGIYGSNNTFEGLQSTACNAQNGTVYIRDIGSGINTTTRITYSRFTSSPTRALGVDDSNVTIADSVFDGLSTAHYNGGAITSSMTTNNRLVIANCSFRNNAAPGREGDQGYVLCSCRDKKTSRDSAHEA